MKPNHGKTEVAGRAAVADATRKTVRKNISRPSQAMLLGRAIVFFFLRRDAVVRPEVRVVLRLPKDTARQACPNRNTSKAAAAVYESAVENQRPED